MERIPNGWQEITATYSMPERDLSGIITWKWRTENLMTIIAPVPMHLAWGGIATRITCHKLIADRLLAALTECVQTGMGNYISEGYGGCFADRAIRGVPTKLSLHALGIAIDLRVATNPLGGPAEMNPEVVRMFENNGASWGGNFTTRMDPMHFQFAAGA